MAAQKTWFERARQVLSNLVVFLLPFVRRKGPLFTHPNQCLSSAALLFEFALTGRSAKQQLILVYGEKGQKMTWAPRATAGLTPSTFKRRSKQSPEVGEIDRPSVGKRLKASPSGLTVLLPGTP
jgi:hypothetical protein